MALEKAETPLVFRALWDHTERLVGSTEGNTESRLHVLPPSFTRIADLVENDQTFQRLSQG